LQNIPLLVVDEKNKARLFVAGKIIEPTVDSISLALALQD